jgi:hypothetical protein
MFRQMAWILPGEENIQPSCVIALSAWAFEHAVVKMVQAHSIHRCMGKTLPSVPTLYYREGNCATEVPVHVP